MVFVMNIGLAGVDVIFGSFDGSDIDWEEAINEGDAAGARLDGSEGAEYDEVVAVKANPSVLVGE